MTPTRFPAPPPFSRMWRFKGENVVIPAHRRIKIHAIRYRENEVLIYSDGGTVAPVRMRADSLLKVAPLASWE